MYKKRFTGFMAILIIVCFLFQLLPVSTEGVVGYVWHTEDSKVHLYPGLVHDNILLIGRPGFKTKFYKITIKHPSVIARDISLIVISLCKSFLSVVIFDYRTVIKQSIPHYFNGTKYKSNRLAV